MIKKYAPQPQTRTFDLEWITLADHTGSERKVAPWKHRSHWSETTRVESKCASGVHSLVRGTPKQGLNSRTSCCSGREEFTQCRVRSNVTLMMASSALRQRPHPGLQVRPLGGARCSGSAHKRPVCDVTSARRALERHVMPSSQTTGRDPRNHEAR